jgi:hypothetical protein
MAITNVPSIDAPSYGGLVYSLEFSRSYSTEASKITYKSVSKDGSFLDPEIGASSSVSFGNFSFDGRVYSYEKSESSSGKILSVTLIDNSTILDRLYVVVFRPGLFGYNGTASEVTVDVKFTTDDEYYAFDGGGSKIVKKNYTDSTVKRKVRSQNTVDGNLIIIGSEEPPDSNCEIASTSYVFTDLKTTAQDLVEGLSLCPITDDKVRKTYEGTLRSVLNSWCQDFGYSFYWDYKNNKLVFFDLKNSVFKIPDKVKDKLITSRVFSESAEGKFNQIAANYFIKPNNPKSQALSMSNSSSRAITMNPYPLSFFIDRTLGEEADPALGSVSIYGGGRSQSDFVVSAACGYVTPALRTFYNFTYKPAWGANCGIKDAKYKGLVTSSAAAALTMSAFGEKMFNMASFAECEIDGMDTNYHCILCNYDEGVEQAWIDLEQDVFSSKIGAFYRGPSVVSGSYSFCSSDRIINASRSVDPEGQNYEDGDKKLEAAFSGRKIFNRGGAGPSMAPGEAMLALGIDEGADYIQSLLPVKHEITPLSSVYEALLSNAITTKVELDKWNTIMFIPTFFLLDKWVKFSATSTRGQNTKEQTWREVLLQKQNDAPSCDLKDPTEKACLSAKEEVMRKQEDAANASNDKPSDITTGLHNKSAPGAIISMDKVKVTLLASSDSPYQGRIDDSYSLDLQVDNSQNESVVFEYDGDKSSLDSDLMETRLILENRTTAENLKNTPSPAELATRSGYKNSENLRKISYSCAGFVEDLSLSVDSGLENLDLSISDSGFSANYSYSTRPPIFKEQDKLRAFIGSNPSNPAVQLR